MMGFDFKEFRDFADIIKRMDREWNVFIGRFILDMGLRAVRLAKRNHTEPATRAYDTGLMRSMWQVGNGLSVVKVDKGKDGVVRYTEDIAGSKGATVDSVVRNGNMLEIVISNPVEYASYVEEGHMTRNRKGFVRERYILHWALVDIKRQIPKRFEVMFNEWIQTL